MFSNPRPGIEVFLRGLSTSELILITVILTVLVLLVLILIIQKWILEDIKKLRIRQTQIIASLTMKLNQADQQTAGSPHFFNKQTHAPNAGQETQAPASEIGASSGTRGAETEAQAGIHLKTDRLSDDVQPTDRLEIDQSSYEPNDHIKTADSAPAMASEAVRDEILTYLRRTNRPTEYKDILRHVTRDMNETDGVSSMNEIVFDAINYLADQGYLESAMVRGRLICKLIDK